MQFVVCTAAMWRVLVGIGPWKSIIHFMNWNGKPTDKPGEVILNAICCMHRGNVESFGVNRSMEINHTLHELEW